jgi:type I restriction enzyme M protein
VAKVVDNKMASMETKLWDTADIDAIEKDNPSLKGVLSKVFSIGSLNPVNLGKLIDEFSNIDVTEPNVRSADVLGHVF